MAWDEDVQQTTSPRPWQLEFRSSRLVVTSVVSIAVFTDVFIYGMVVPILPIVLKTRVVVPDDQLQTWMSILLAAFGGALFIGSPIFGYFADKYTSRQGPFIVGLLALGGSTTMFWIAGSLWSLVIARVLQGLSAAVVWTVGMALVVDTVGKDEVGVAMGYVSMAMTVGTVFGPFIGGFVLSRASYHAVFAIAIALIVLDILLRLVMIEQKTASQWIQTSAGDEAEGLLNGCAEGNGIQYEATVRQGHVNGESIPSVQLGFLPGIVRLICYGDLLIVLGATVVDAIIYTSFDTVLPLYVMKTFNYGPLGIGLCFLPLFAPAFLSAIVGDAVDRYGATMISFLGFLLDLPTFLLLQLVKDNTTQDKILFYVLLLFAGLALTFKIVALMVAVSHVVEQQEKEFPGIFGRQGGTAQAYGLFNVAWSAGQMLGPLIAGLLMDFAGWGTMVSVFGAMAGLTAVVLALSDRKIMQLLWKRHSNS